MRQPYIRGAVASPVAFLLATLGAVAELENGESLVCDGVNRRFPLSSWESRQIEWNPFTEQERVDYYMGAITEQTTVQLDTRKLTRYYIDNFVHDCLVAPRMKDNAVIYWKELWTYMSLNYEATGQHIGLLMQTGDVHRGFSFPIITKTRPIQLGPNNQNVLLLLTIERHLNKLPSVRTLDTPHESKRPEIVWRGGTSGRCDGQHGRCHLVERWVNHENEGIHVAWSHRSDRKFLVQKAHVRGYMNTDSLLKYKYLVSAEGNDVASNLKWLLLSNSTPFLPAPRIASWFMEDRLVPWVHYVPLEDNFCDLREKYQWCLQYPKRCEAIAVAGRAYMEQFLNMDVEARIIRTVLTNYAERVSFELVHGPDGLNATTCDPNKFDEVENVVTQPTAPGGNPAGSFVQSKVARGGEPAQGGAALTQVQRREARKAALRMHASQRKQQHNRTRIHRRRIEDNDTPLRLG